MNSENSEENEREIEEVFNNNSCTNQDETEKPLSPILISSVNRKYFGTKNRTKSRIKSSKIFEKEEDEQNNTSFTLDLVENDDLVTYLDKLEQIEKNREVAYKILVSKKNGDLCFKKPTSPAPKTPKRFKPPTTTVIRDQNQTVTPVNDEIRTVCTSKEKPIILPCTCNFQTATGKNIEISKEKLEEHSKLFEDILNSSQSESNRKNKYNFLNKTDYDNNTSFYSDNSLTDIQIISAAEKALNKLNISPPFVGFTRKDLQESEYAREKFYSLNSIGKSGTKREMQEEFVPNKRLKVDVGFSLSSGKKVEISSELLSENVRKFEEMNSDVGFRNIVGQFTSASGKAIKINSNCLNKAKEVFKDVDLTDRVSAETKVDKSRNLIKDKLKYFDQFIGDEEDFPPTKEVDLLVKEKPKLTQTFGKFFNASGKSLQPLKLELKKPNSLFDDALNNSDGFSTPDSKKSKRKLGLSTFKQIPIDPRKLHRARLMFDEDLAGISPIKQSEDDNDRRFCSTPIQKEEKSFFTEIGNETVATVESDNFVLIKDCGVAFDIKNELEEFNREVRRLEERLVLAKEKVEVMERMGREKSDRDKKPVEGVLYKAKRRGNRKSFGIFVNGENPGRKVDGSLFHVTPKNAVDFHFKQSSAKISTEDGATVVPNTKNLIGIPQIEFAFRAMPGVDPRLLPKNWIKNHYKWIIWKLASYQRVFPDYFTEILTVEQVIQQLKYRYDREIDKAERSAIRKILEKDDVPQKRMVLCVSDVIDSNELELTDGWYAIRTKIDERLCCQIVRKRIEIGTKLMISGAELINCDGCHPLDVTESTFLKINFNCTRRAKWDARLGYQSFPGPFSVPIHTVHPQGGVIGRIDVCVARNYPFKYLDKSQIKSVWRNERAHERTARNWEKETYKKLEELEENSKKNADVDNQQELATKMKNGVDRLKSTPVMKLLVVDLNGSPTKPFNMFLWKPTEDHAHILKENSRTAVFNVYPKTNGDLHSGVKTMFESKSNPDSTVSDIFKRKLTKISDLEDSKFSENFKEFDTVGIVVRTEIEEDNQELWLVDYSGRLLLIKIFEGPKTCLLLDNLKRGQITSVSNLIYKGLNDKSNVCRATANHFTIFSSYPKFKHLQEGLDHLKNVTSKGFDDVLNNCDKKIEKFKSDQNRSDVMYESDEDSTLISTRITSTDIALSLIDFDQFIC